MMPRSSVALLAAIISIDSCLADTVEGTAMAWQRITISSPVEEIVSKVNVEEGDLVANGEVLAELSTQKQELELRRLDLLLEKAKFTYETTAALYARKIESKETMLEKKVDLDELSVQREMAQALLDERRIRASIAGTVVHRFKDPGESIGRVEALFELIDASRLKLLFFLPAEYLGILELGMICKVDFPTLPGNPGKAKLIFIDPQVDARSGLFRVRFEFDNSSSVIKPGVEVTIDLPDPERG